MQLTLLAQELNWVENVGGNLYVLLLKFVSVPKRLASPNFNTASTHEAISEPCQRTQSRF
jgi:hypothetical protein